MSPPTFSDRWLGTVVPVWVGGGGRGGIPWLTSTENEQFIIVRVMKSVDSENLILYSYANELLSKRFNKFNKFLQRVAQCSTSKSTIVCTFQSTFNGMYNRVMFDAAEYVLMTTSFFFLFFSFLLNDDVSLYSVSKNLYSWYHVSVTIRLCSRTARTLWLLCFHVVFEQNVRGLLPRVDYVSQYWSSQLYFTCYPRPYRQRVLRHFEEAVVQLESVLWA